MPIVPRLASVCLRIADCATPGGTCTAAPKSSSGAGDINPLDLTAAPNAMVERVSVYDHFVTTTLALQHRLRWVLPRHVHDANTARAINDCTSPLATPTAEYMPPWCRDTRVSAVMVLRIVSSTSSNTQPTVDVTTGIMPTRGTVSALSTARQARGSTLCDQWGLPDSR